MERARARVVKVRESRERERRDKPSSMATQDRREAGGRPVRERDLGSWMGDAARLNGTDRTEVVTAVTDVAERAGQMLWVDFKQP